MTQEPTAGEAREPCPFGCSRRPAILYRAPVHYGYCGECGCEGPTATSKYRAIAAWNRRAPASVAAEGEAVAWQRFSPMNAWVLVDPEDIPHYERAGQQVRALYAHPARMPTREQLARVVDPAAFLFEPSDLDLKTFDHVRGRAYRTADALIALFTDTRGA
jgi:hypothetical protein